MNPCLYRYRNTDNGHELYLGGLTTMEGLSFFDETTSINMLEFGATQYQKLGWATERDIPELTSINQLLSFLDSQENIGLAAFKVELSGIGSMSTHDDVECHFLLHTRNACMRLLGSCISPQHRDKLINKLLTNQGCYLSCSETGVVRKFESFKEYLDRNG